MNERKVFLCLFVVYKLSGQKSTLVVPNPFLPNFGIFIKNHLADNLKSMRVRDIGKMAARVWALPAGSGQGILNWLG